MIGETLTTLLIWGIPRRCICWPGKSNLFQCCWDIWRNKEQLNTLGGREEMSEIWFKEELAWYLEVQDTGRHSIDKVSCYENFYPKNIGILAENMRALTTTSSKSLFFISATHFVEGYQHSSFDELFLFLLKFLVKNWSNFLHYLFLIFGFWLELGMNHVIEFS